MHSTRNSRGAFTLIELMVSIAIVSVLLSLLLGALSGARRQALSTLCVARLGEVMKAHALASGENRGQWANAFRRGDESITFIVDDNWGVGLDYFDQTRAWIAPLFEYVWSFGESGEAVTCPAIYNRSNPYIADTDVYVRSGYPGARASYYYSTALFSDPDLWDPAHPERRAAPAGFRRWVGVHEVTYPSAKVVMSEYAEYHGTGALSFEKDCRQVNSALADGHARRVDIPDAKGALPLTYYSEWVFPADAAVPFNSSPWGFRGADF